MATFDGSLPSNGVSWQVSQGATPSNIAYSASGYSPWVMAGSNGNLVFTPATVSPSSLYGSTQPQTMAMGTPMALSGTSASTNAPGALQAAGQP